MTEDEGKYRLDYFYKHVHREFVERIEILAEEIKLNLAQMEFESTDKLIQKGISIIRQEIENAYARSVLAAFLIEEADFCFSLNGVKEAECLFDAGWAGIVREGDPVLLDSWVYRSCEIAEKRSQHSDFAREIKVRLIFRDN